MLNQKHYIWFFVVFFIGAGFLHFYSHRDMPIVRNSLVYARIIDRIDYNFNTFNASHHAYNKPLGFAYLSLPWVQLWGLNTGIQFLSCLFASLWVVSLVPFYRRFCHKFQAPERKFPTYLLLSVFNPLLYYQFISGYPDLLFALSFLWGVFFLDRFFSKGTAWYDGIMLGLICLCSVWVKHNGFIFFPIIALFFIIRFRVLAWLFKNRPKELILGIFSLGVFFAIVGLAQAGYDFDLFNLRSNTKNFGSGANHIEILRTNWHYFLIFLLFSFSFFVPFIIPIKNWKNNIEWYLVIFIFLASLFYYRGTNVNFRYYLTLLPFFSLVVVANLQFFSKTTQRVLLCLFLVANSYTLLYYNSLTFNAVAQHFVKLPQYDNFRLVDQQKQTRESIDLINKIQKEKGFSHLFFLSNYYLTAMRYSWEKDGFFNSGISIIYDTRWKKKLWGKCECDEGLVYDYESRSYNKIKDERIKSMFVPQGHDVFIVKKQIRTAL